MIIDSHKAIILSISDCLGNAFKEKEMTMTHLRCCPFCGHDAKLIVWRPDSETYKAYSVACEGCGAAIPIYNLHDDAVKYWQSRVYCQIGDHEVNKAYLSLVNVIDMGNETTVNGENVVIVPVDEFNDLERHHDTLKEGLSYLIGVGED